jgi:glycogen(starch) synthase
VAGYEVVMLTWEYPPRIVGGIAPHVYNLSRELARLGVRVHVVTCDFPDTKAHETEGGVQVDRVDSYTYPTPNFATWVSMMNVNLQRRAAEVIRASGGRVRVIHAHDWLVANAAIGLKHMFRLPLVSTIHSTEKGRRGGIYDDYQRMISSEESWLTGESWRIICCSNFMMGEVTEALGVAREKIDVVPNGIDPRPFRAPLDPAALRARFARPDEKLVLYVGRLVHEKGVNLLVEATPYVLRRGPAKIVMVGEGYLKESLIARARQLGVSDSVYVTGFLESDTLRGLFRVADVSVVPSLYEPFGIVALEAMAAGTPIVTLGTGGLSEILQNGETGHFVQPNPASLADGISTVLYSPSYAESLRAKAAQKVPLYSWANIASLTTGIYRRTLKEYDAGTWKPTPPQRSRALP